MRRGPDVGTPEPGARRPRGRPLTASRDRIVAAALQIVDDGGAEALSMRTLAQHLGCSTATLYRHFPNRSALIIEVIDLVMGEVDLDAVDLSTSWQESCRRFSQATFDALSRHRNVAPLLAEHPPIGPHAMALRERRLEILLHHGFPPSLAADCVVMLARYALGFASQLVAPRATEAQISAALHSADPAIFPATAKAWAGRKRRSLEEGFAFGLDLILDGMTQLRAREQQHPDPR